MTDELKQADERNEPTSPDEQAAIDGHTVAAEPTGIIYLFTRTMHYPNAYTWLLLLSAMDIMLTWVILSFGGGEVNPLARWIIDHWQLTGMITYKFSLILFFIMICEIVGTLRDTTGLMLSRFSVCIAMVPVVWSLVLLARFSAH